MTLTFQLGETLSLFPAEASHFRLLAERRILQAEERARKAEYRAIKAEADRRVLLAENSALLLRAENRALRLRQAEAMMFEYRPHNMKYGTSETITRMNWRKRKKTKYRFPWLQTQAVNVGDDVFNHIMTFVEEGAMFKFRRVNKACYHLFYSRQKYNDTKRVMMLAGMGRQFSKLKNLVLPKLTTDELCCLVQHQFPKLETLSMPYLEPYEMRFLPAHGAVKILSEVSSAHSITEERFPNLSVVRMYKSKNERLRGLHPHSKIEILDLNCNLNERGYSLITREKFPSLRSLKLYRSRDLGRESNQTAWLDFKARLQASRIHLTLL